MKIIGIDTSTDRGSVALLENGRVRKQGVLETRNQHSASLFPLISELLEAAGWSYGELDAIGAGIGPGSFTGIRVGLAGAEGLAAGLRIPLVGVVSFQAAALASSFRNKEISVLLDARRGRLYGARYRKGNDLLQEIDPPCILGRDQAEEFCRGTAIVSPDADGLADIFSGGQTLVIETVSPEGGAVARLAEMELTETDISSLPPPRPLYLSGFGKE